MIDDKKIAYNFLNLFKQIAIDASKIMATYTGRRIIRPDETTYYDIQIQKMAIKAIQEADLDVKTNIVGEENERLPKWQDDAEYVVVIDPIDGTKEFAEGRIKYAFCIALVNQKTGIPVAVLMYAPRLILDKKEGAMFSATEKGAYLDKKRIYVRQTVNLDKDEAIINHPRTIKSEDPINYEEVLKEELSLGNINQAPTASITYLLMAASNIVKEAPILITHMSKLWDVVPGAFIAQQAGAIVSYINGKPLFPLSVTTLRSRERIPPVICTINKNIHKKALKAISSIEKTELVERIFKELKLTN